MQRARRRLEALAVAGDERDPDLTLPEPGTLAGAERPVDGSAERPQRVTDPATPS